MIFEPPHPHRASYDDDGNIIVPSNGRQSRHAHDASPQEPLSIPVHSIEPTQTFTSEIRRRLCETTSSIVLEGTYQYQSTWQSFVRRARHLWASLWAFLTQPVWVLGRKKKVRKYNRSTLFIFDTVRFGTTFALLFLGLFICLNYQSFLQMASSYFAPIQQAQSALNARMPKFSTPSDEALKASFPHQQRVPGDMLSYLPIVGPRQNLLIVPRLGLHVPITNPPFDALVKEDWEKLEKDIQNSLENGVVHYPGTAQPGQAGNFFVTGHSSYYPWASGEYKTVFARLHQLEVGDEYFVYYGGDRYRYVVREKNEVKPSNVHVLDQPLDRRMSTLMTCTPVGTTLRRLIISAEEVDPLTGAALAIGKQHTREMPKIQAQMLPI